MTVPPPNWDSKFRTGGFDFLRAPHEQIRHAVVASLIEAHGPGEICDLGCGEGHLLRWLDPRFATRYIAVDISEAALGRIDRSAAAVPVETLCTPIESLSLQHRPISAIVGAEVLYSIEQPGSVIARLAAGLPALQVLITSIVASTESRPKWRQGAERVYRSLADAGWVEIERVELAVRSAGLGWTITVHRTPQDTSVGPAA